MATTGETPLWRKSSRCKRDECLELSLQGERVLLRSSHDVGVVLSLSRGEWDDFAQAVRRGEFDEAP